MNRKNFDKMSTKKQNKVKEKFNAAKKENRKVKIMNQTLESIKDGTAKVAGNEGQEYIKTISEGITFEFNKKTGEGKVY